MMTAVERFWAGRMHEALAELQELHSLALQHNDAELAECASHNLAALLREVGEDSSAYCWQQQSVAWREHQRGLRQCTEDDALARLACDLSGRGADEFLRGQFDLAETFWRRALAIEEWRGSLESQAADCGNLGLLAATRGDLPQGIHWLRRSLRLHRATLDLIGGGKDLLNLAELYRLQGDVPRMTLYLRRAIRCFVRADAPGFLDLAQERLKEALRIAAVLAFDASRN